MAATRGATTWWTRSSTNIVRSSIAAWTSSPSWLPRARRRTKAPVRRLCGGARPRKVGVRCSTTCSCSAASAARASAAEPVGRCVDSVFAIPLIIRYRAFPPPDEAAPASPPGGWMLRAVGSRGRRKLRRVGSESAAQPARPPCACRLSPELEPSRRNQSLTGIRAAACAGAASRRPTAAKGCPWPARSGQRPPEPPRPSR